MKKKILAIILGGFCFAVSCKKDEKGTPNNNGNNNNGKDSTSGYWKMNTTTYKVVKTAKYNNPMFEAADSNTLFPDNYCHFYFSVYPQKSATYKIVDDSEEPKEDELSIVIGKDNDRFYSSNGGSAAITVNGGKITVKISGIKVYDNGANDSADFNCDIVQK